MRKSAKLKFVLMVWPCVFVLTVALSLLTQWAGGFFDIDFPEQTSLDLVRRCAGWNWQFLFLLAQVLVLAPVVEELLFRCVFFALPVSGLRNVEFARWIAISFAVLSSALFSAAHYLLAPFPDNAFLALFFFGLAQCWFYRRTGSLWCAMLNHFLFNVTNLVLLFILQLFGVTN